MEISTEDQKLISSANKKVNKKVKDNFDLYLKCADVFKFSGKDYSTKVRSHSKGVSALQAFNAVDSMGINPFCNEPELLTKVWNAKAALNLQIELWAGGINDGVSCIGEFQDEYNWLPDWVWDSIRGQRNDEHSFHWFVESRVKDTNMVE